MTHLLGWSSNGQEAKPIIIKKAETYRYLKGIIR
jgi:hypothetical protein